jgi:two-component system, NtrC family, response regulator AtoC
VTGSNKARPVRILVVEDDPRLLEILLRHLGRIGYDVQGAGNGFEAVQITDQQSVDVILTDIRMPGMDGETLLSIVRDRHPETKVVLMTAFGSVDAAVDALKAGAYSYVCKPFKVEEIAVVLRNASREILLARQVDSLSGDPRGRYSADRLIGRSDPMKEVRRFIRESAAVAAPILVTGRSGTGKEMAVRAIHHEGPRATGPLISVNCAAIPEALFESAMFGHARGAFTGADREQIGLIEQSNGGTLFLDEVAEMPLPQQAKLLRVLQERELQPIGSTRLVELDLRIICATNRSIEAMVRQGEFREDLFYRINVLPLRMPELHERPEDIPILAEHLLAEVARENGCQAGGFTEDALHRLRGHRWPGNVRELRNCIERALLRARHPLIDAADLEELLPAGTAPHAPAAPGRELESTAIAKGETLAEVEKAHIERVLAQCEWNRSAAARVLGIDRRTLYSKIQRHGLIGPLR